MAAPQTGYDPVAESRRLVAALTPVAETAAHLAVAPNHVWDVLRQVLRSRVHSIPVGESSCSVVVLDDKAVDVVAAIRGVAECERLAEDIERAAQTARDLPPLLAPLSSVGRVSWLFRRGNERTAILEAISRARLWDSWAQADCGLARLRWAAERLDTASQVNPADVVDPEHFPMAYAGPISRALGLPTPTAATWLSLEPLRSHRQVLECGTWSHRVEGERAGTVRVAFARVRAAMVARALQDLPLSKIRDIVRESHVRLGPLERAGLTSVQDVLSWGDRLTQISGVGDHSASQAYAAAVQLAKAVSDDLAFRFDVDSADPETVRLVCALKDWSDVAMPLRRLGPALDVASACFPSLRRVPLAPGARLAALSTEAVANAHFLAEVDTWQSWERTYGPAVEALEGALGSTSTAEEAWADFRVRAADYYAWLGQLVGLDVGKSVQSGHLPAEIADAVRSFELDTRLVSASLRGYQEFGAKYALAQQRCILGDEMGLGKTVQAIAVMAHLAASGGTHSLVVCPASVLVNWLREIPRHSRLRVHRLHGGERFVNVRSWQRLGGVGVTTFGQLDTLGLGRADRIALLVADEAHYLKNRRTRRGLAVEGAIAHAERVMFLTGTPLENRLSEFESLVSYVQPTLLEGVDAALAIGGPRAFREHIAPVYLRRNQLDVLTELPERIDIDEWVELAHHDRRAHDRAVRDGNFMALRRAAFLADGQPSAKLERLTEIVVEAFDNSRRVVVFSFFRDVLDTVVDALQDRLPVFGPLTGSTPPDKRQSMIDKFSSAEAGGVLVSQVDAGGVGTNIQAASVVVLCEPQVKPSSEVQAVARVHRMGQLERVMVHRLLGADSVDQRMLAILAEKRATFDRYVRDSAVTGAAPEAIDVSERELAARVIAEEQRLLAERAIRAASSAATGPE